MNEFPDQLVRASTSFGTMLDVALVLEVDPSLVYRWIAGVDLPSKERIVELSGSTGTASRRKGAATIV